MTGDALWWLVMVLAVVCTVLAVMLLRKPRLGRPDVPDSPQGVPAASAAPALPGDDPWFTHWGGGWAAEWTETTERLTPGTKTVASAGGVRPSLHRPPIALYAGRGRATETSGSVLTTTLLWGGDTRFDAELAMHRHARLVAGVQHRGAERVLDAGDRFVTPTAVLLWSDAGLGPSSRSLHRWARDHVIRDGHRPRALVFNNWETMFFDLDPAKVAAVVDGAADTGAELFLLDDGWFGGHHPRDDDGQGLGDWTVDERKFPDGLAPVVEHVVGTGMRFGLWIEPEMVNPRSECYEQHPDWVISEPGRERREERNQLVLDVLRPEVRDFIAGVVDDALALHPAISYLKWDANRDLFEVGSPALPADRQTHLAIDRVRATEEIMAEVARRHPEVGRARLVVEGEMANDRMTFKIESAAPPAGLAEAVAATLRDVTKLRGDVLLCAPGSLPNDGKVISDQRSLA